MFNRVAIRCSINVAWVMATLFGNLVEPLSLLQWTTYILTPLCTNVLFMLPISIGCVQCGQSHSLLLLCVADCLLAISVPLACKPV